MSGRVVQGWHPDPFGVHEARYFSAAGEPTKLVRDRGVESYDDPPTGADALAAATARLSAVPAPPAAYAPRDAYSYSYGRASERDSRRRPDIVGFAASGIILAAVAVAGIFVAQTIMSPKHAATPGSTDVAFVNQAATRTLQQHTADVVLSDSTTAEGADTTMRGTGAFGLDGKAGTMDMTINSTSGAMALRDIWLNGYLYTAIDVDGRGILPKGKEWTQEPFSSQGSGTADFSDPSATLASLEKNGITVSALGTKVIGGVTCTGYTVTPPGAQSTMTVWINPQHLLREISENSTFDIPSVGASASPAPTGAANAMSVDLTMDLAYSAAPLHLTAPPAASTVPYDTVFPQSGQSSVS